MNNVPTTTDTEPTNNCPLVADELHRIADAIATLRTPGRLAVSLTLMTPKGETTEQTIAGVDEAALAVLGEKGHPQKSSETWFHLAQGGDWSIGFSYLGVQASIPAPPDERDAELKRLRAELAELRSSTTEGGRS